MIIYTKQKRARGFTLVEVLLAAAIGSVVIASASWFMVECLRATIASENMNRNNIAEWGIVSSITIDSKVANGMYLYKNAVASSYDTSDDRLTSGKHGNLLVLTRTEQATSDTVAKIELITCYVFNPTTSTLKKATYTPTATEQIQDLETILTANYSSLSFKTVATEVTQNYAGTTTDPAGAFYYRDSDNQSGVLSVEKAIAGRGTTTKKKLIESAFNIRS